MQDTDTIPRIPVTKYVETKNRNYDIGKFFGSMRQGILFVLIFGLNLLVVALGAYIGYQRFLQNFKVGEAPLETVTGALLGLASFMLAFTFSTTWSRFAARNGLMIQHSQAINVCWLRTSLITQKQKLEVRRLLQEYTRDLLSFQTSKDLEKLLNNIESIHLKIWEQTASLAREDIDSELRSLFTVSVTDLISISNERRIRALILRIPDAIWGSLLCLSFIGMFAFGYQAGVGGMGRLFHLPLLPAAFAVVIVLIADLNSPYSQRHFRVNQKPLVECLEKMEKEIP